MRVLIATDGSPNSLIGLELAAGIHWPDDTTIRLVTVIEPPIGLYAPFAPAMPAHVDRLEQELVSHGQSTLEAGGRAVARTGRTVEQRLIRGRPGSSIVDEAERWAADLLILGSRGHGAIASMVLGSVGSEVVDHAPCPVLVARRSTLTRVLLGHDGSTFAIAAEQLVGRWTIFEPAAVEVLSVAAAGGPWRSGFGPTAYAESIEAHGQSVAASTAEHTDIAQAAARRLAEAGRRASAVVVAGDPAASIVRVADDHQADLIVLGTHGRTGLVRALLGSVARNVMQHATCSVLVVRSRPVDDGDHAVEAALGAGPTD